MCKHVRHAEKEETWPSLGINFLTGLRVQQARGCQSVSWESFFSWVLSCVSWTSSESGGSMCRLMDDVCKATGLSPRQVFAEARFKFVGMASNEIRITANAQYDEYVGTNRLPDYVEEWCLNKLRQWGKEVRQKAVPMSRVGPIYNSSGVDDLSDNDGA